MKPCCQRRIRWMIFVSLLVLCILITGGCKENSPAKTPTDANQILVSWSENSPTKAAITEYVQSVTDENSEDFIPVQDRIAVFDEDGTILAEGTETATVLGVAVAFYRVEELINDGKISEGNALYDNYRALQQQLVQDPALNKSGTDLLYAVMGGAFEGMAVENYITYVSDFMETKHPALGITWADAFYRPMIELIDYLQDNDFTVYIVSGSERITLWGANAGILDLPRGQIIGSDINLYGSNQPQDSHKFFVDDELLRQRTYYGFDFNTAKVFNIYRQIGKKPVMAFGNSSGDYPMINYTNSNDNYRTFTGLLIHDDSQREYEYDVDKYLNACHENGWTPIHMKDEFKTFWMNE